MIRHSALGAVAAVVSAPAAAALLAALYRFPVPFRGYASGIAEAPTAALAALFYLALGGAVVVGGLGALAGALLARRRAGRATVPILVAAFAIAVVGAAALAVLEFFVGTW
ncbi:hypothetical protein MCHIJ_51550 [Mycolicibacterium chitae]|uniref:Transmembrane protein n=2 Tax=Mycolicibacterium chitae TaxID=1792 RepID=A0A3S4SBF2_MYCCI|nr:hypothetical protein [Mycolicibacterium chitae]BBZ05718.1 hypothetical protein MCHIJ_51550 [Mycolicibacterium chitae]VEG49329.1 Uncharacterised protein [Mycolicibacterium chitae]